MPDVTVYDKAKWHFPAVEAQGLPYERAFVHTGLFVAWAAVTGLVADVNHRDLSELVRDLETRKRTGPKVFEMYFDGVLMTEDLNEDGNAFVQAYFDFDRGLYLKDYEEVLIRELPSQYQVEDTWDNYDLLSRRLDQRLDEWRSGRLPRHEQARTLSRYANALKREARAVSPLVLVLVAMFLALAIALWVSLIARLV